MAVFRLTTFGLSLLLVGAISEARAQTVRVVGTTQEWKSGGIYIPAPNVDITVTRNGSLVKSSVSIQQDPGSDAIFDFDVPSGEPFTIVFFYDDDHMPQMQDLSGRDKGQHYVSPAIMTIAQYNQQREKNDRLPTASEKLDQVSRVLPLNHPLQKRIQKIRAKLG